MPYILKAFRILFPLTLIAVGVLWMLGRERQATFPIEPMPPNESSLRLGIDRELPPQKNLTKRVAKEIAEELLAKNQNGPQETGGELSVQLNPAETLAQMMQAVQAAGTSSFKGVPFEELRIGTSDSADAKRLYISNVELVLKGTINSNTPPTILDAFAEALGKKTDTLAGMIANHEQAIAGLKEITVPPSMAALHKKEIDLLMKTAVMLRGMALVNTDPLRAYLALQLYPKLVEEARTLQEEFSAAISGIDAHPLSFFIKSVYASVPTIETNQLLLQIFPRDQYEYFNRILTEALKGNVLDYLKDLVLDFVRGDGTDCSFATYFAPGGATYCPKVVLNWEQTLFSAQEAADARLEREIIRSNIQESNKEFFAELLERSSTEGYGMTFDTLTRNAQECPDTGDPIADLQCITDMQNSIEGQFIAYLERKSELEQTYEEGKKAEGIASEGFESTKKCVDEYETRSGRTVCLQWEITEPGSITQDIAAKTATVDWDRIVNAFDLQSLLGSLASVFINQLLQAGEEGLLGLIESGAQPGPAEVPPPPGPIVITFTVTPGQTIEPGSSATISWNATNSDTCSASGAWSGERPTSGSEVVTPPQTSTYTLTCTDQYGGTQTQSVTITVQPVFERGGGEEF